MKKYLVTFTVFLTLLPAARAQETPFRISREELTQLLTRLNHDARQFQQALKIAVPQSVLKGSPLGTYIQQYADELRQITERLQERGKKPRPLAADAQEALNRGPYLETFMSSYQLGAPTEQAWQALAADLQQLAEAYRIATYWGVPTGIGAPPRPELEPLANQLIGTYQLEESRSENARKMVEQAARDLSGIERRQLLTTVLQQLRAPKTVAIDRHGNQVTLATSLQAAHEYTATGHAYSERVGQERVLLYGNHLRLNTPGEADNLFAVTYATIENGTRLHVTRTAFLSRLSRPLIVVSYYKKVSDVPQLKLGIEEAESPAATNAEERKKKP